MSIHSKIQRIAVWVFMVLFGAESLRWLFGRELFWYFNAAGLWFAVLVVVPSIAFLRGHHWCRFVIGSVATVLLLVCSMMPGMIQPAPYSHGFWALWAIAEGTLIVTAITCFFVSPRKGPIQVPEPTDASGHGSS